jgi:benzoyl-CoA reductase subunit C
LSVEAIISRLGEIISRPSNPGLTRWKSEGKPVVGFFCSYVPLELFTAASMLPVRLRGASSTDSGPADTFLSSRTCTYVRHTMTNVLQGHYDFLDGVICLNTCDHVRRSFDLFRHKTNLGYFGFLSVPRNARESLYPYFREEVANLRKGLYEHFGSDAGDEALEGAIRLHNRIRRRLSRIEEFRAGDAPVISGADLLCVAVASQVMPASDFLKEADNLIEALEAAPVPASRPRARLLLAGGELDEPDFVAAVESQGAAVVADSICLGMRTHQNPTEEGSADPFDALCRRYFFQNSCARMIGNFPERVQAMIEAVEARKVDGIVFQRLKFCDPWGGDAHNLRHRLAKHDIPFLVLEREYGLINTGQVRTRVQAFLELIESRARRKKKNSHQETAEPDRKVGTHA